LSLRTPITGDKKIPGSVKAVIKSPIESNDTLNSSAIFGSAGIIALMPTIPHNEIPKMMPRFLFKTNVFTSKFCEKELLTLL
jgi:hypothetical protein